MKPVSWNPNAVHAEYHEQPFPEYRGNPFIGVYPPVLSRAEAARAMARFPIYDESYRHLPREIREDWLPNLDQIRQPMTVHLDLYGRIRRLLLGGYLDRNPALANYYQLADAREDRAFPSSGDAHAEPSPEITARASWGKPAARGLIMLGVTGIGKTALIKMILELFPQVIEHQEYAGRRFKMSQITYVHLQAPKNGSIITCCINFFQAVDDLLGTDYERTMMRGGSTVERLMPRMARVAALHGLGLLVMDEIQELKSGVGERVFLSFLGRLTNELGVPVVMVGGVDALPILRGQFRLARRGHTEGDILLDRSRSGAEWRRFVERLWRFQVTRMETPLDDLLLKALMDASQGITDYVVKLYKQTQLRAIAVGGDERITKEMIASVAADSQIVAQNVMDALRANDVERLRGWGDVIPLADVRTVPFARGDAAGVGGPTNQSADPPQAPVEPAAVPAPTAAQGSPKPRKRKRAEDRVGSIPALVADAKASGGDAYDALAAAGFVGGEPWAELVGGLA